MRLGFLVVFGLAIGVGLGVILAVVVLDDDADSRPATDESVAVAETAFEQVSPAQQAERAEAFVEAWTTFRTVESLVESTWVRTTADGERLETVELLAQRPGDRLIRSLAGVQGYLGGVEVFCTTPETTVEGASELSCRDLDGSPGIDAALDAEVLSLEALFSGNPPAYRIFADDTPGCWELLLTIETLEAPFGDLATYCFDPQNGTLVRSRTEFSNGIVETVEAQNVRTEVTTDDFLVMLGEVPRGE